jgi:hypothetical protein
MRKRSTYKVFVYFLCFSFLLLTSELPRMAAEAKERSRPIGEMISRGVVKFEAGENVWKRVEPSHFPIFQEVRIKTEKGQAFVLVANDIQITVSENTVFTVQRDGQFHLLQGRISFRIPSGADMSFRVGNLSIGKSHPSQAGKRLLASPQSEETVGAVVLIRGSLSIRDRDRVVLAVLPNESVTIPSFTVFGSPEQKVAGVEQYQIVQYPTGKTALDEPPLGLSGWTWMVISLAAVGAVGGAIALGIDSGGSSDNVVIPSTPVCP